MPNGQSHVKVTRRFGPDVNSNVITSLQNGIRENGGALQVSNGASASLVSVKFLCLGMQKSYCLYVTDTENTT